jgi:2-polyprenyl-3-methyl-5-hydroxy-6-metoxy-1,4-benzoquinol methylase
MANAHISERQRIEKSYHDEKYRDHADDGSLVHTTRASQRFWELVGEPTNLTVLDFGCGNGWLSVRLAKLGNTVYGFDISGVLVEQAREFAAQSNVTDRTVFKEMAAEDLDFPPHSFDEVIGQSILHHVDLETTLPKIRNVLKDTGTAHFLEPMNQNLLLKGWRALTPWRRTPTERALTNEDLEIIRRHFPSTRFRFYCLTSMAAEMLFLLSPKNSVVKSLQHLLENLDERIVRSFPGLGRYSAVVVLELRK